MIWIMGLIISLISAVLGRAGGSASGNRLFRLLGVPVCVIVMILVFGHLKWSLGLIGVLLLTYGAILGASSTYFKAKDHSVLWWNWIIVGIVEGLALLPFAIYSHFWIGFAIRTVVCGGLICLWDILIGLDWLEEGGRYFLISATVPLLFL